MWFWGHEKLITFANFINSFSEDPEDMVHDEFVKIIEIDGELLKNVFEGSELSF